MAASHGARDDFFRRKVPLMVSPAPTSELKVPVVDPAPRRLNLFRLFTVEELEQLPEADWSIEGVLPEGSLAMLYGEAGTYKTFLGLDWALSVSAGRPWNGREVHQGDVVYVYAEGSKGMLKRIRAWCLARGPAGGHFRTLPTALDVLDDHRVQELIDLIRHASLAPNLVIIDTLARCFGDGDENTQKDMNAFVAGCDAIRQAFPNLTVLVIHHAGKNPKAKDRGSTALRGAADTVMHLKRPGGGNVIILSCEKQKDAPEFSDIRLVARTIAFADGTSSLALEASGAARTPPEAQGDPRAVKNDRIAFEALVTAGPAGLCYSEWLTRSRLKVGTFKAVRHRLLDSGKVHQDGRLYTAVQLQLDETGAKDG
jgi:hypothetical protein